MSRLNAPHFQLKRIWNDHKVWRRYGKRAGVRTVIPRQSVRHSNVIKPAANSYRVNGRRVRADWCSTNRLLRSAGPGKALHSPAGESPKCDFSGKRSIKPYGRNDQKPLRAQHRKEFLPRGRNQCSRHRMPIGTSDHWRPSQPALDHLLG